MINYIDVPYYSQFQDVPAVVVVAGSGKTDWQKSACGVASMAMLIDFYKSDPVSVVGLLKEGVTSGAYQTNVGWKHYELAALADRHGLSGRVYNFSDLSMDNAIIELKDALADGPVIASIYNKFDPVKYGWLGHLIVVTGYDDQGVFYRDPASTKTEKKISYSGFRTGWKKKFITVRPKMDIATLFPPFGPTLSKATI